MERITNKIKEVLESTYKDPQIFGIIAVIFNILFVWSIYSYNPYKVADNYPVYTFLVILFVLLFMLMTFFFIRVRSEMFFNEVPLFNHYKDYLKKNGGLLLFLISSVLLIYFISYVYKNNEYVLDTTETIFIQLVNIFIFIGAVSIIYTILKNGASETDKNETRIHVLLLSLLRNLIFYIPCIFIDVIEWVKAEYKITTKTIWIILLLEMVFVSLYFILPPIFNKLSTHDGIHLLDECVYLNNKRSLGSFEQLHKVKDKSVATPGDIENSKFKYTYAISAWYYINPQPPNTSPAYTKYATILDYGKKPLVQYNALKNKLRVQCEISNGNMKTLYETSDIKHQKWNNIVVNYDGGIMDVFINGALVSSTPEIAPYMTYENVIVGQTNGIQGGICNVMYYKHILSSGKINMAYKLLRNKHVPLF
jgi:hypothetical protein